MTQTQSLQRGVRHRLGLGTGSCRDGGKGDKATVAKCLAPKLRYVQQTQEGLLPGKTSNAPTLSAESLCPRWLEAAPGDQS